MSWHLRFDINPETTADNIQSSMFEVAIDEASSSPLKAVPPSVLYLAHHSVVGVIPS